MLTGYGNGMNNGRCGSLEDREFLARQHRSVVSEFIEAVVNEWAGDRSPLEQNLLGALLRSEVETRLVPGMLAMDARLLEADAHTLGHDLPAWLDRVSTALPAEAAFLTKMGRMVDPAGSVLLEENFGLFPGESVAVKEFRCRLWEMAPLTPRSSPGG